MQIVDQSVSQYFSYLDKYALQDLEKMLECADYNSDYKRLAVPIAQSCFSLLDIMGFLLRDLTGIADPIRELRNSKENIKYSLSYFLSSEIRQLDRDVLIQLYRHGNMHSFFPKKVGIHNTVGGEILLRINGVYNLNVHPFCRAVVERLRLFFNNFINSNERHTFLSNFLIYESDLEKSFNGFSGQLTNTISSTITTTIYNPK